MHLQNALTALFYIGADTPQLRATLESAQARRHQLRDLKFEQVP